MRALGGPRSGILGLLERPQGEGRWRSLSGSAQAALDHNSTIIGALELSEKKWFSGSTARNWPYSRHVLGRLRRRAGFFCRASKSQVRRSTIPSSSEASQRDLRSQALSALETYRHGARQHIHASRATLAALAARAHWLAVKQLPNYAPELNDIEPYGATSRSIIFAHLPAGNE